MAQKVAGTCYIKVDGEQLEVSGGIEVPLSDTQRETVMGLNGVAGFKEIARAPSLKLSAIMVPGFPLERLTTGTDMTITAELANGMTYVLSGAYLIGEPSANPEDGTAELEFNGTKGMWQ